MAMSPSDLEQWLTLAARTPSADNSQPWRFEIDGNRLSVHFFNRHPTSLFGCDSHATLLSIGAMAHTLKSCGAEIEWRGVKTGAPYFVAQLPDNAPTQARPYLERYTNRFPYQKGGISMDSLRSIAIDPSLNRVRVDWITNPQKIDSLARCVGALSRERFTNQAQHESLMSSLRYTAAEIEHGTGLDINTLHLPPGGQSFMRWITPWTRAQKAQRFGVEQIMALTEQTAFRKCGAVCVISGGTDDHVSLQAGAIMVDLWKELNQLGLAVQPCYVLSAGSSGGSLKTIQERDQGTSSASRDSEFANVLNQLSISRLSGLHMALKVGIPRRNPKRALRLPVATLSGSEIGVRA
jgi:hypothetical protein